MASAHPTPHALGARTGDDVITLVCSRAVAPARVPSLLDVCAELEIDAGPAVIVKPAPYVAADLAE